MTRATSRPVLNGASFALARGRGDQPGRRLGIRQVDAPGDPRGPPVPDAGEVRFDSEVLTALDEAGRAALRANRIGVVLQSDNLIPFLTAAENVELAIELAGGERPAERARELLDQLGLGSAATTCRAGSPEGNRSAPRSRLRSLTIPTSCSPTSSTAELDSTTRSGCSRGSSTARQSEG